MDAIFIDANIFLEVALENNKKEACKNYLEQLLRQEIPLYTTDFILYTCLLQLERQTKDPERMKNFLQFIHHLPIEILHPDLAENYFAIECKAKHKLTFDDALILSTMTHRGIPTLLSLDKDFDRIKTIQRIEP